MQTVYITRLVTKICAKLALRLTLQTFCNLNNQKLLTKIVEKRRLVNNTQLAQTTQVR